MMTSELPREVPPFIRGLDLEHKQFFIAQFKLSAKAAKTIERKKAEEDGLVTPATINKELNGLAVSLRALDKKLQRIHEC